MAFHIWCHQQKLTRSVLFLHCLPNIHKKTNICDKYNKIHLFYFIRLNSNHTLHKYFNKFCHTELHQLFQEIFSLKGYLRSTFSGHTKCTRLKPTKEIFDYLKGLLVHGERQINSLFCLYQTFPWCLCVSVHSSIEAGNRAKIKKVGRGIILTVRSSMPYLGVGISFHRKWRVTKSPDKEECDHTSVCQLLRQSNEWIFGWQFI